MNKFLIAVVLVVAIANPAIAQIGGDSNDTFKAIVLYHACNPPVGADKATRDFAEQTCQVYFRGLTDGLFMMTTNLGKTGCLPAESPISNAEARHQFESFFKEHPEAAQNSAAIVASYAIMKAHPCAH